MTRDYTAYWNDLTPSHANHPGNRFRYDLIIRELRRLGIRPHSIVDCGCGDGSLLREMTKNVPCQEAYGIDIAANVPASRPGSPFHFEEQDLGNPIRKSLHGLFDLVLCSEVIEHVQNDDDVLMNLASLAAPQGIVILTTQTGRIYKTEQYLGHIRHYALMDLIRRVEAAGLRVRCAYQCGWPWLNLQKLGAHVFQKTVQKQIVQATELSLTVRLLFAMLVHLYRFSSRSSGPQLVIVADKL